MTRSSRLPSFMARSFSKTRSLVAWRLRDYWITRFYHPTPGRRTSNTRWRNYAFLAGSFCPRPFGPQKNYAITEWRIFPYSVKVSRGGSQPRAKKITVNTNFFWSISDRTHNKMALSYRNYDTFKVFQILAGLHSENLYYLRVPKFARFKAGIGTGPKIK